MKKLTAMLLALIMVLSMAVTALADDPRNITIGLWWDIYYDSNDESWEDNEAATGKETDLMRFDNVKNIEDTYGVTYEFQNLTYAGVQDSVNNSILAGEPDCDVYMVELGWGVPAVMNGYAMDLRDVLDPDDPLLTHNDIVMNYVALESGAVSLLTVNGAEDQVAATYPLAFNLQMIEEANLEDPRELAARGEWTWDKFREYCIALTKDNGSGDLNRKKVNITSPALLVHVQRHNPGLHPQGEPVLCGDGRNPEVPAGSVDHGQGCLSAARRKRLGRLPLAVP